MQLSVLRTHIRERSDQENSTFITDAELTRQINLSLPTLRDMLIRQMPEKFISSTAHSISTVSGTHTYSLASDHYRIAPEGVELTQGSYVFTLPKHNFRERNRWQNEVILNNYDAAPILRYVELGKNIRFTPTPSSTHSISVWYIPQYTSLSADSDETETGIEQQWLEWVILDCAIKIKGKAEEDSQLMLVERQHIAQRIEDIAKHRLLSENQYAVDVDAEW